MVVKCEYIRTRVSFWSCRIVQATQMNLSLKLPLYIKQEPILQILLSNEQLFRSIVGVCGGCNKIAAV